MTAPKEQRRPYAVWEMRAERWGIGCRPRKFNGPPQAIDALAMNRRALPYALTLPSAIIFLATFVAPFIHFFIISFWIVDFFELTPAATARALSAGSIIVRVEAGDPARRAETCRCFRLYPDND